MGFTIGGSGASRRRPVHPHIRGVYTPLTCEAGPPIGPSPHTWGLQGAGCKVKEPSRSIPTYVGFTGRRSPGGSPSSVHPHIRGVYGSYQHIQPAQVRSIPTYVGFTHRPPGGGVRTAVHPHIRGVYCGRVKASGESCGPSPHTWGLRVPDYRFPRIRRSIPTYVGFTE